MRTGDWNKEFLRHATNFSELETIQRQPWKLIGTNKNVYIRKEDHRTGLEHWPSTLNMAALSSFGDTHGMAAVASREITLLSEQNVFFALLWISCKAKAPASSFLFRLWTVIDNKRLMFILSHFTCIPCYFIRGRLSDKNDEYWQQMYCVATLGHRWSGKVSPFSKFGRGQTGSEWANEWQLISWNNECSWALGHLWKLLTVRVSLLKFQ